MDFMLKVMDYTLKMMDLGLSDCECNPNEAILPNKGRDLQPARDL